MNGDRRFPLGLFDEPPSPNRMTPGAGWRIPGPLGISADRTTRWSNVPHLGVPHDEAPRSVSPPFTVGPYTYRLRQGSTALLYSDWQEEPVQPPEAVAIIEAAALQHRENAALLQFLETAASQLRGLHRDGTFVLVWLRPRVSAGSAAESPRSPARPAPKPQPIPAPAVKEPVMTAAVAAAQAATLRQAAASGVPFCEECARAAAEQQAAATAE